MGIPGYDRQQAQKRTGHTSQLGGLKQYALTDGRAAGIRAVDFRTTRGLEFTVLGLTGAEWEIEPWTPLNTLTWAKVMAWDLGANMDTELERIDLLHQVGAARTADIFPLYGGDFLLAYDRARREDPAQLDRWQQQYDFRLALVETGTPLTPFDRHLQDAAQWTLIRRTPIAALYKRQADPAPPID